MLPLHQDRALVGAFDDAVAAVLPFGMHLLFGLLGVVIWLGGFLVWILLMYKAYSNEKFMLPIIGALAEKQA